MASRRPSFSRLFRSRARRILATSALAVVASLAVQIGAGAHQGAQGVILERMTLMEDFGTSMQVMSDMFKARTPYDPETLARQSATLSSLSKRIPRLFPSGTNRKPSEATPAIWRDWQEFEQLTRELTVQSNVLAEQAGTLSAKDARRQFARIAKTCTACHKKFRLKAEHFAPQRHHR